MSRKIRRHKTGWERKAKKTAQLLNGFGIASTAKIRRSQSADSWPSTCVLMCCWKPWRLGWIRGHGSFLHSSHETL